jgi:hypothetical protein
MFCYPSTQPAIWRKPTSIWRTSSYSLSNGECIEVGRMRGKIGVRDSKNPAGPALSYSSKAWRSFLRPIKASGNR